MRCRGIFDSELFSVLAPARSMNRLRRMKKYAGNTIRTCVMLEPRQTPITPSLRVRKIDRARLLELATTAMMAWAFIAPTPLSNNETGMEAVETTPHIPKTTRTDIGTCSDFPIVTRRIQGPANTRIAQTGTARSTIARRELQKALRTQVTSPRASASPYAGQIGLIPKLTSMETTPMSFCGTAYTATAAAPRI